MIFFTIILSLTILLGSMIGILKFNNHRKQIAFEKKQQLQLVEEQEADAMIEAAENGKSFKIKPNF